MLKTPCETEEAAVVLELLGDKTRLNMMKMLDSGEYCECEFVEIYQISQPVISKIRTSLI